jgi:tellurite resistance protein
MAAFDAPNREMCVVDRGKTNTPLQALVTLNDPQFAEAARVFASSILQDPTANDDRSRIERAFEVISSRLPTDSEIDLIARLLAAERARFQRSPRNAERVIAVGEYPATQDVDPVEQAAWTQIATLLLNLSEVLTRQ